MYNLVLVRELLKMAPFECFEMDRKGDELMMGYFSMPKPTLTFCLSGYCSQRTLLMSNKSPGNVHFSSNIAEAAVTVGDAKRNETLCFTQHFFL